MASAARDGSSGPPTSSGRVRRRVAFTRPQSSLPPLPQQRRVKMAPVETDAAARSNNLPVLLFGGQTLLVAALTAHVLLTARRAAQTLPPATRTRSQNHVRRRHARVFSALALLSLASVATFAVVFRVISYVQWAELGSRPTPGSLWQGWYGTGEHGVGAWHLGDWARDVDLVRESDAVAVLNPAGFFYTAQHFTALLAASIFIGVEGHRRSLSPWTVASFVVLGAYGSLAYALSLFFVTLLYTPTTVHHGETPLDDTLFTPKPAVYWAPIVASLLILNELPKLEAHGDVFRVVRSGYVLTPLFLAFAPQVTPVAFGSAHPTKSHARRSYQAVFHFLSVVAFVFHARVFYLNMRDAVPAPPAAVWDLFASAVGSETTRANRLLQGLGLVARKLRNVSQHPALSVTTVDVAFTALALLTWTFTRDLDPEAILESSVLSPLVPGHRQHVRFFEPVIRKLDAAANLSEPVIRKLDAAANLSEPVIRKLDAATNLSDPAEIIPTTTPSKSGRRTRADAGASTTAVSAPREASEQASRRSTRRSALAAFDDAVETVTGSPTPQSQTVHDLAGAEPDGEAHDATHVPDDEAHDATYVPDDEAHDATYVPDETTRRAVQETEADGAVSADDYVEAAESTGVALFLAFLGGAGQLASAALGAEVRGS
ncbi:uncharacterized protein M421DRAFT_426867 [Didymella exigua CBS 183.55]|uniref:Uncharacterized protein n=1 Tax=Didymella exigua CBS 183.55 TaxID=1150837 RepID=A0A6A5R5M9_9PLEO|nr:uncharacterized protein M421DRAFT_426867 [Didymella exigua CBS 183.55]KAF1922468.1 hypothetical protein M421DRAFT_426867 [Didymella exigua CBS 183.55]